MFAIDNSSSVASQPTPVTAGTPGWFTDGNPVSGSPPTILPADFCNQVMAELLNIVNGAGLTPSKTNNTQILQALASGKLTYAADTGTANTYVASLLNSTPNANLTLTDGLVVRMKIGNTNTGASSFNLNGLGAKSITLSGAALTGGELVANDFVSLQYDTVATTWHITSPVKIKNSVFTASATGTGTANALVIATVTPAGYALTYGNIVNFTSGTTNTGASTLNVSSTGAITVKKNSGTGLVDVAAGDLTNGNSYSVNYNGTYYVLIASTPVLTGFLTAANNLSDLANLTTALTNLGVANTQALSGSSKFPGGLIIQWGAAGAPIAGTSIAFPTAFPNNCWQVLASGSNSNQISGNAYSWNNSTFTLRSNTGTGGPFQVSWIAIGN